MMKGEAIIYPKKVDRQFLASLNQIQNIFSTWANSFSRIPIVASPKREFDKIDDTLNRGVGTFFTGGVDSFYTLIKHRDEISHLIYVHGFENYKVTDKIKEIAVLFDKKVIEIKTNLRDFSDPIVNWHMYHGSALATVGHLLKHELHKIYIPSSNTYNNLIPWGSNALVDPLWSSSDLQFVHDGSEATRVDKIANIVENEPSLKLLRVCWKDTGTAINCGKCEKCIRTMICLKALNVIEDAPTFPDNLVLRKVLQINADNESTKADFSEIYFSLKKRKADKKLIWALWWVLYKPKLAVKLTQNIRNIYNSLKVAM